MMKFFALLLILLVILIYWICVRFASIKNVKAIEPEKARIFSDEFLDDFLHDRREAICAKMSKDTQNWLSQEQIDNIMNQLCHQVGKIIKFEFVSDVGKVSALSKIPSREMTYEVTTDQGKTYPFTIVLVPNENELAVKEFNFSLFTATV